MKKQAVLWMAVLLFTTWIARGQTVYPMSMVIERQSPAEREVIELSKIAKITFSDGKMHLSAKDNATLPMGGVFSLSGIAKCLFSTKYAPTGILSPLVAPELITWRDTEGALFLEGLDADRLHSVAVYAANGATIASFPRFKAGTPIPTVQWAPGVYLILINNQTIKYVKK
ncbi:hypothetical protein [uncultured Porphyromonas sp.]|uniref:hypothetical protein n=1 Tax=uncultured Porphyromonas sp. TaxID=159274 RepID=UPI00260AD731|nr:hypothetical protein [uncultured Porphyromonas sp.]